MRASSISRRRRILYLVYGIMLGAGAMILAFVYFAARLPLDAPLARMYRTEADLALLKAAVDAYFAAHGAYPPAGSEGLRAAASEFGKSKNYLPQGPPLDAWSRQFHYVPPTYYPGGDAGRGEKSFAPTGGTLVNGYQIFSAGADGLAEAVPDNITSWDTEKPWRAVYRDMNREFMSREKTP